MGKRGELQPGDTDKASAALEKRRAGQTPTAREDKALRRVQNARDAEDLIRHLHEVPSGVFLEMTGGKPYNSIAGIGRTWGLEVTGAVDLFPLVRWLFDFLADNQHALKAIRTGNMPLDAAKREDVRWKRMRTRKTRVQLEALKGDLLDRQEVREGLAAISAVFRRTGEAIGRRFGEEAREMMEECWDDAQRMIDRKFGGENGEGES